ncbi:hypothetical protein GCM10022245_26310 [Streptomyces mayteni]
MNTAMKGPMKPQPVHERPRLTRRLGRRGAARPAMEGGDNVVMCSFLASRPGVRTIGVCVNIATCADMRAPNVYVNIDFA